MSLVSAYKKASVLFAILICTGCATTDGSQFEGKSAEKLYSEAAHHLKKADYHLALEALDALESRFPFGESADNAQLALIYAYFKNDDFDGASAAAERFIQLHPRHPDVSYAFYMKALSSFEDSLIGLRRYLPVDHGSQEIEAIERSFFDFAQFIERFPSDPLAPDAHQRMIYLKNVLADNQLAAAHFYREKGAPVAAANRATEVIQAFDNTPALPEALYILSNTYQTLGLTDLANDVHFILQTNYARSPWAQKLEEMNE
jgi:outer membrane protein assembly factor BamD